MATSPFQYSSRKELPKIVQKAKQKRIKLEHHFLSNLPPVTHEKFRNFKRQVFGYVEESKNDNHISRTSRWNHHLRLFVLMDRTALAGFGGSLASVSGSLHEVVGLVAGAMTIVYMAVKIYQEVKKK